MIKFLTTDIEFKKQWFADLRYLAGKNLSQAHLMQHQQMAKNVLDLAGINNNALGAHSHIKPADTVEYHDQTITGKKHWVSNAADADYGVFTVKGFDIVYVPDLKVSNKINFIDTLGMEETRSADIEFNGTPAVKLFNKSNAGVAQLFHIHDICFVTNQFGVAEGLYKNTKTSDPMIELQLNALNLLWESLLPISEIKEVDRQKQKQIDTVYAFGKFTLVNVLEHVLKTSSSGLYNTNAAGHQLYKDALIYSSHGRNLQKSFEKEFVTTY